MKAPRRHLFSINDLFCTFDLTRLKGKGNIKKKFNVGNKRELLNKIFLRYLYIMFSDLVQGGKIFTFPSKKTTLLSFRRMTKERLINARKSGAFEDLDLLISDFTYYEMVLTYYVGSRVTKRPVKLSNNFRDIILNKVNTGYKYC